MRISIPAPERPVLKTLLICEDEALLDREGLARWLASFSDLAGIVSLVETRARRRRRIRRELQRVGPLRFLDVLAFQLFYRLVHARRDRRWQNQMLALLLAEYDPLDRVPVLITESPNSPAAERFIRGRAPDLMIARCKCLLSERIFSIAPQGTFVMRPGICPEYRNAHGCFWALATGDRQRVGMTLLKIDKGVDTGPVYGYYSCEFDDLHDSHVVIQHRAVLDNLDRLRDRLIEIGEGRAHPLDTSGRLSAAWGQPWLTRHLAWKWRAREIARRKPARLRRHAPAVGGGAPPDATARGMTRNARGAS